jgi:hypothetical protein
LIYVHRKAELNVQHVYPGAWRGRVTTLFPKQGHYANDDADALGYAAPDVTPGRIGELATHDFSAALAN